MIGMLYYAYSAKDICAEKLLTREGIIDYIYNDTPYRPDTYREITIGPQTFKYYLYKGAEQAGYYFSALPHHEAIDVIMEDVKVDIENFKRKYDLP